jgi:hypothetical protein
MSKQKRSNPGRRGTRVSLAPLTLDQAMAGLLKVDPKKLKQLEAREARAKRGKK